MKKLYFLFLFAALTALSSQAAETTLTWEFTAATSTELTATSTSDGKWVHSTTTYYGKDTSKGAQLGSSKNPFTNGTITYDGSAISSDATIKSITLGACVGSKGSTTVQLTVGGENFGSSATITSTTTTEYVFEGPITGNAIVINCSDVSKAFYIKKISVTYETAGSEGQASAPTFSLAAGDVFVGDRLTLSTATEGADILYKVGDATDWTTYSAPITFDTAGSVTVTAKTAAYGDLAESAEVSRTYNVVAITDVASLAEFVEKGKADNTAYYRLTCPVTVIDQYISSTPNNSIYVVDTDNNGVMIYITGDKTKYAAGTVFAAGIVGKFTDYSGQYELVPATLTAQTAGTLPAPQEMAIADMTQDTQGRYVKLTGVEYDGTNFVSGENKVAMQDKFSKKLTFTSGSTYNVVGLTAYYYTSTTPTGIQIFPLSAEEVVDETKAVAPTADVEEGAYTDDLTVKLSSATEGATILYKINDATDWTTYTDEGISLKGGSTEVTYTITAKAVADGLGDSDEATFSYTINYYAGTATLVVEDYAATNGWANGTTYETATVDVITFTATKGTSNEPKYYTSDKTWRMYTGGTFTVSVPDGYAINKITFTTAEGDFASADSGTYASKVWTAADGATTTAVKFTLAKTTKVKSVNVEYTIIPSVKVEVYEMENKTGSKEWVDITNEDNKEYSTEKSITQVRVTYVPAIAGRTSTMSISDVNETVSELVDYTVTADNEGVYTYTFPETTDDFMVEVEFDSNFYGKATYTIMAANTSSVADLAADGVKVTATQGGIEITAASAQAAVYDAAGRMAARRAVNGTTAIALSRGLYIVVIDGKAVKVAVR